MNGMTNQFTEDQLNTTKSFTLRYVIHEKVKEYEENGWIVVHDLSHCHHGRYSVIMEKLDKLQDN